MANIQKIKKPTKIILDADSLLFAAANSAQQVQYRYSTPDGETIATFDSAKAGKIWLEDSEMFGADMDFGYEGDFSELIRDVYYNVGDVKTAYKTFDNLLKEWLNEIPHKQWRGKVAAKQGAPNFRKDICTLREYKGQRKNTAKPYYTEDVRKHALKYPEITKATGGRESDDYVCAIAQKYGQDCIAIMNEKDIFGVSGTWFYAPDLMEEPYYSDPNIIGELWWDSRGKLAGCGLLFWIAQACYRDQADNYIGCEKFGEKGTMDLLGKFSGKGWDSLKDVVYEALQPFRKRYGEEYKYNHCMTGEPMIVSFRDIFIENIRLAYMVKSKDDGPEEIVRIAKEFK